MNYKEAFKALPIVEATMKRPGFTMSEVPLCEVAPMGYGTEFGVRIQMPEDFDSMLPEGHSPLTTTQQVEIVAAVRAELGAPRGCLLFSGSTSQYGTARLTLV